MPRSADHYAVLALLRREHTTLARAFFRFTHMVRRQRLTHNADAQLRAMQPHLKEFAGELSASYRRAYGYEYGKHIKALKKAAPIRIEKQPRYTPGDPDAADYMRQAELDFIQGFNDDQRDTVRNTLTDALDRGLSPNAAARSFRDAIGLTDNQAAAVRSYRMLLEASSAEALNRELRDARSDRVVTGAISRGDVLSANQVDLMVDRYSANMVAYRADTIALTESHRAVSAGRQQALQDLADEYNIDENNITRTWNSTLDARTRDTHAEMDGQEVTGFEPFRSPGGALLQYPGDPAAPPEETIRCRCVETYAIATPDDTPDDTAETPGAE